MEGISPVEQGSPQLDENEGTDLAAPNTSVFSMESLSMFQRIIIKSQRLRGYPS